MGSDGHFEDEMPRKTSVTPNMQVYSKLGVTVTLIFKQK